jgi:hypothetical protein
VRKFLLGLVCGLLVVGVANMGHAFWIFGGGGGGGKGGNGGRPSDVQGAQFDFDFMRNLPVDSPKDGDGPVLGQFDIYSNHHGMDGWGGLTGGDGPVQTAVPEPATMILLGIGLIGLAGYGRNKFRK